MTARSLRRREIDQQTELDTFVEGGRSLSGWVILGLNVSGLSINVEVLDALFLGCEFRDRTQKVELIERGAHVFPRFSNVPYNVYRHTLYTPDELLEGWEDGYTQTRDFKIYAHFDRARHAAAGMGIREALAQRIHDHGIDDAIEEALIAHAGSERPGAVGVMGGHGVRRDDPYFAKVAQLTWKLARHGYFVASGGGPGIMEAANLGAYLAPFSDERALQNALDMLKEAPKFDGGLPEGTPEYLAAIAKYIRVALEVCDHFFGAESEPVAQALGRESTEPGASLAIPTWFYGHEPTNLFGTLVAKYFSNSLREDNLLALSTSGVVFAPGSAGTLQEVFMDLAQNHYATFVVRSPMVFLGRESYQGLYDFILDFVAKRGMMNVYGDLLHLTDDPDDAAEFIRAHPPRPRQPVTPLYDLKPE